MKKLLITTVILAFSIGAFAQEVPYYKWSDHTTFILSKQPAITGYGMYSDSLSNVYPGKTFYEYNNEYYPIESWADYYRWYISKYFWFFDDPDLYEYFYITKNDLEMAKYVSGNKYKGKYYPSDIIITFPGMNSIVNNTDSDSKKIRKEKDLKKFNNMLKEEKKPNNNSVSSSYSVKNTIAQHSSDSYYSEKKIIVNSRKPIVRNSHNNNSAKKNSIKKK